MTKSELLIWLHDQYRQWQDLLREIGNTHMEEPGADGDWSIKDLVSHMTVWNHWLAVRMDAALHDKPAWAPPWPADLKTDDEINAWIYRAYHGMAVSEVLEQTHLVFQEFLTVVEQLPDDAKIGRLDSGHFLVWLGDQRFEVGEFFDHFHDDHEPNVRAWLARRKEKAK